MSRRKHNHSEDEYRILNMLREVTGLPWRAMRQQVGLSDLHGLDVTFILDTWWSISWIDAELEVNKGDMKAVMCARAASSIIGAMRFLSKAAAKCGVEVQVVVVDGKHLPKDSVME